jgi:hypothetical protein
MNYPAASHDISIGKSRSKGKANIEEYTPHWEIKKQVSPVLRNKFFWGRY